MKVSLPVRCLLLGAIVFSHAVAPAATQSVLGFDVAGDDETPVCPVHKNKMISGAVPIPLWSRSDV